MAHTKSSVIFLLVLISFTCAQLDKTTTTTETPIDPTISTSTSVKPTETPATTSSSTTTEPTTMTVSTTSSSTTAPTTIPPVTTTNAPVPTTPKPAPPQPEYTKWSFKDNNQTCVIVQLAAQFNFTYNTADKTSNVLYNVPVNRTKVVSGSCEKESQSITVQWGTSKMMLQFTANDSASEFMLSQIYLSINVSEEFSDAAANQIMQLYHVNNDFTTPLAMSYHCNKLQTLSFASSLNGTDSVANATISHVQLEAFHKQNNDQFATARDCEAIDTPDIVPIAVGCALAGLVVIVLIAYLVGRRRAQARGYLSM